MSEFEPDQTRGVRNPKVVDLITFQSEPTGQFQAAGQSQAAGTVVLQMIEDRPFGSDPDQIVQLEEKFNNYIDFVLDGWLVKQYPQYDGKAVRIELLAVAEPDDRLNGMLTEMTRFAERIGLEFRVLRQQ